jgi:hypothetical protein
VLVAEHLDLDMARIDDEFLDEDAVVAERGFRLRARAGQALRHLGGVAGDAHALAAAAGRGLDHDRVADLVGDFSRLLLVGDDSEVAGDGRDLGLGGRLLGFDLVAHGGDGPGIGADEDDPRLRQRCGKGLALRQKPVARVHRLGAGPLAGVDDPVDDEIALGGGRRADQHGLVRHLDVERVPVGLGIDRDRADPHATRGLDDPAGDLAAIGDQDALEHIAG